MEGSEQTAKRPQSPSQTDAREVTPALHRAKDEPLHVKDRGPRRWWVLPIVFVLGIVGFSPAWRSPFLLDDYLHVAMVDGTFPVRRGPVDLYDFVSDVDRKVLTERGVLPWWSHPQLTIRFFRPLSSAMLWASHRAFGARAIALHMPSMLWWMAAVLAAHALFRRAFTRRVSLFATAMFALAPCHAIPLAWLANFEVLVSLALGIVGLAGYVRWREERSIVAAAVSTLAFAGALCGGEYALCFAGYLFAFEIVRRGDSIGRRIVAPLPFVLPAVAYFVVRFAGNFGTRGSGFYTDPLRDPLEFLGVAPWRLLTLIADGWLTADAGTFGVDAPRWLIGSSVVGLVALLVVPIRRMLAALDVERRRTAQWMLLGSFFAMAPVLAVAPSPRVLGIPAIGIAATVALLVDHAWFPREGEKIERRGAPELTGFVALILGFAHLVHGPATSWLLAREMRRTAVEFREHASWLREKVGDLDHADVVVVRGLGGMFFAPFALDPRAKIPARWRILSMSGHVLLLRRDARTIELISPGDRSLTSMGPGNLFRKPSEPLHVGDSLEVPGVRATVLEMTDDGPRRVRYVFDRDLESPGTTWIAETVNGFQEITLPKVGFGLPLDP